MKYKTLLSAGIIKHKSVLLGIFILVLLVSLSLGTVITIWANSRSYINLELGRAGFGELTAWVSTVPAESALTEEIAQLEQVKNVQAQSLVFSNYIANEHESDSEGQLILFAPEENRYRFFTEDLSAYRTSITQIKQGEVYVSPSLISMMNIKIGDDIYFAIARNGKSVKLTVAGFYEDPFMGSSMIGMKGFLISNADYTAITDTIASSGIDALARDGAMLHIFKENESEATSAQLNKIINEQTSLASYTEFVHSADAISGFMLILQYAFCALLTSFVVILLFVVMIVLGHSITDTIETDYVNMGILKTTGFTSTILRRVQLLQYATAILPSMLLGIWLSHPLSRFVSGATLTTTGISIPSSFPWGILIVAFSAILLLLTVFIYAKIAKIKRITPIKAIRGEAANKSFSIKKIPKIDGKHLSASLALRQVLSSKKRYISALVVAVLLVFFTSVIGRIDTWLGADGKGMMDAFNPADHDIGVQIFGEHTNEQAQNIILSYTDITDSYLLAMPSVAVNGVDYTANIIQDPERFHILQGRACTQKNEIVITEFVAADLGVFIGDTLNITANNGSGSYIVTGIYSCANDMGANIGMSREGYLKIGQNDPQIWCHHYFLNDSSQKANITQALEAELGGDVHIHENTWPGLFGIISAMRAVVVFMYIIVFFFVLVVTIMTGSKLLSAEQQDIGIFKALGFTVRTLRISFALRFVLVALIGSVIGVILATIFTNPLVSTVMKLAGISNFAANPGIFAILSPAVLITLLFFCFAYFAAGKIKRMDLSALMSK